MTLASLRATTIVLVDRVTVRGPCTRRGSSIAALVGYLMGGTVLRCHAVRLPFRWSHDSLHRRPLQTDGELKHHQRCNYPVGGSVTHERQTTPLTATKEE